MKRDLKQLAEGSFDLLILGGGIYGAAAAWEAASRGLSVAMIDRGDFGCATSSNSLKIIHGGLRYLQHADLVRMRESIIERRTVMRIAPHLIRVFPCLMPTYGHQIKGPEVMTIAMLMNDVLSCDRNRGLENGRRLPMGHVVSKQRVKELIPHVDEKNMTGGAMWYDAQVYNSERLLFSYLHSAAGRGAQFANYLQATGLLVEKNRVQGARVVDRMSGESFDLRAGVVVNNLGAWTNELLASLPMRPAQPALQLSTAMNLIIRRSLTSVGAGISAKVEFRDPDAIIRKGSRLLFIAPWRNVSMVGTWHDPYEGRPDDFQPGEEQVANMLRQVNDAMPGADIRREEVLLVHRGFLPMSGVHPVSGDVRLLKHYRIIDHRADLNLDGLLSVVSVKYTTARDVAVKTVNAVFKKLQKKPAPSISAHTAIDGGEVENLDHYTQSALRSKPAGLADATVQHLIQTYGTRYARVLKEAPAETWTSLAGSAVIKAEILHGVREEMAQKLSDVVLRRTELGSAGHPGAEALTTCAQVMAAELGWDAERRQKELAEVEATYPR